MKAIPPALIVRTHVAKWNKVVVLKEKTHSEDQSTLQCPRFLLTDPSRPYRMKISNEWCWCDPFQLCCQVITRDLEGPPLITIENGICGFLLAIKDRIFDQNTQRLKNLLQWTWKSLAPRISQHITQNQYVTGAKISKEIPIDFFRIGFLLTSLTQLLNPHYLGWVSVQPTNLNQS